MRATLLHKDSKCDNVKINCYSGITGLSHDEYITIDDNNVIWSCGSKIIKSFHLNPSITPNTDIPMTLRSATKMNIDTPLNYFKDINNECNNDNNDNKSKVPFINDNAFDIRNIGNIIKMQENNQRLSNNKNNKNKILVSNQRENNENVNTDNNMEQTPPLLIKNDDILSHKMDIEEIEYDVNPQKSSFSGLTQDIDNIDIKSPISAISNKNNKDNNINVIDVIWCYFPNFQSLQAQKCLCLLQNENITIISLLGNIYYVPLPIEAQSIWALPEGLMIQSIQNNDNNDNNNNIPILFSLLNPLEELKPISLHLLNPNTRSLFFDQYYHYKQKRNTTNFSSPKKRMQQYLNHNNNNNKHGDFFCDTNEVVIFSCTSQPIIVTFNKKYYYHTIWVIRHSKKKDNNNNDGDKEKEKQKENIFANSNDNDDDDDTESECNPLSISSIRGLLANDNKTRNKLNFSDINIELPYSPYLPSPIHPQHQQTKIHKPFHNKDNDEKKDEKHYENDNNDNNILDSELLFECCWKEKLGVLYDKIKSIYGVNIANHIDFNEKCKVFFACDIYNDPIICLYREKSQFIASYRLTCKNLDDTFSGKCGGSLNNVLNKNGSNSLNIQLLFLWTGIKDIQPIRSLRSLTHCDDDDYHYYQFYASYNNNNNTKNNNNHSDDSDDDNNDNDNDSNDDFESLFNCNESESYSFLHRMQEMSSFDFDLLVLNDNTKTLSIYSANYKLCNIVLPKGLNISMINSLSHAINNRITLNYENNMKYRVSIPRWDKNIRIIAILKCFQLFLSPDLMHCIRILLIELHHINNAKIWYELSQIILYIIRFNVNSCNNNNNNHNISKYKDNNKDIWQRLQSSNFHKLMCQKEEIISSKLKIDNNDNNDNNGNDVIMTIKGKSFVDENIKIKIQEIINKFDKLSFEESNDKRKWDAANEFINIKSILSSIDESIKFDILLSIHLLYENCKLSSLLKCHLESLSILLSKISLEIGMFNYFDFYCRDFGYLIIPKLSKYSIMKHYLLSSSKQDRYNDKNICPVPSIYQTIIEAINGNRQFLNQFPLPNPNLLFTNNINNSNIKNNQFHTGSYIFSPILAPYSLLRKILYFYDILTKPSNNNYNIKQKPLIETPLFNNSYITPYTPSSIKRTKTKNRIVSPLTPYNNINNNINNNYNNYNNYINEKYPYFSPSFLIKKEIIYNSTNCNEQLILAMVEENFNLNDIDCLPLGIAIPLRESLKACKYNPPSNWPKNAYLLIGREDLINNGNDNNNNDKDDDDKDDDEIKNDDSNLTHSTSKTFIDKDRYKYKYKNNNISSKSRKQYEIKKLLQKIGAPKPKLHAVNDINAIHKSCDNIKSATKTLKSLFSVNSNFMASSMIKHTKQRLINKIYGDIGDIIDIGNVNNNLFDLDLKQKEDYDGTMSVLNECLIRFGSDYRLKEVRRILKSDKPRKIRDLLQNGKINNENHIGRDIKNIVEYHINLFYEIKRRIAQCIGRGMFTIWSYFPTATKPIDIPNINLSGIVTSRNLKLDIDFSLISSNNNNCLSYLSSFDRIIFEEYEQIDNELFLQWIQFHNGCSAGLRVLTNYDESIENIRTWICYNKPKVPSYSHAGFIFAQGLNGHLTCLMPADFYWYLGHKHEPTTMAIILGASIARRGTMDNYIYKMLSLHIPSMLPNGFNELGIETTVQSAALLGIGFLFLQTKHKLSTDMLLIEIVRRSSSSVSNTNSSISNNNNNNNDNSSNNNNNNNSSNNNNNNFSINEDRECYSLCSGIALGLIHLGMGGTHLNLENRLEQLMANNNGKRCNMLHYLYDIFNARTCISSNYTGSSKPISKYGITTGIPGGAGSNSQSTITGLSVFATSNIINPSQSQSSQTQSQQSQTKEPSKDDQLICSKNHLRAAIHYFMPNFSDYPDINNDLNNNDDELNGNSRIRDGQWINTNMTAPGAIIAFGLMYLKTNNKLAAKRLIIPNKPYLLDYIQSEWIYLKVLFRCLILWKDINYKQSYFNKQIPKFINDNFPYKHIIKPFIENEKDKKGQHIKNNKNIDYHAITLCYINIICATCFAISLKYAGSHNENATKIIRHYLTQFLKCRNNSNLLNIDGYTIETILGIISISLSIIMCGSGNLELFKIYRELRMCIKNKNITYGHHEMYSMSIGFLFLGGGKLTFGTTKLAIASLIISCYPRFPIHSLDNQYYLQILRHLYVLAIEKRFINTIDIDTNLPINNIEINIETIDDKDNKQPKIYKTPCLLPSFNKIKTIKINDDQFWEIKFNHLQKNLNGWKSIIRNNGIIYLKRKKTSYCSNNKSGQILKYQYKNIINILNNNILNNNNDLMKTFDSDSNILQFIKQFCCPFTKMGKFCGYTLFECLNNSKYEMIQTYIKLYHSMSFSISTNNTNNFIVQDIKLLNIYYTKYNNNNNNNNDNNSSLIQMEFIAALKNKFENLYRSYFQNNKIGRNLLLKYVKNGWNLEIKQDEIQQLQTLGAFLSYSELYNHLIINNSLKSLNEYNKYLLLPLLNISIKSELQKINDSFGYYPSSLISSSSSSKETPPQTPSLFNIDNNNNNNKYKFLPKSFGLSVLTNVLINE